MVTACYTAWAVSSLAFLDGCSVQRLCEPERIGELSRVVAHLLMQQLFPVGGDTSGRARRRLIFRMPTRSGQARTVEEIARAIVVEPPLTRLETRDNRMAGRVMMLRRVLIGR